MLGVHRSRNYELQALRAKGLRVQGSRLWGVKGLSGLQSLEVLEFTVWEFKCCLGCTAQFHR